MKDNNSLFNLIENIPEPIILSTPKRYLMEKDWHLKPSYQLEIYNDYRE